MKEKLQVKERLLLLNALPNQGDILTLRTVRDFKKQIEFSEKEQKEIEMKILDNGQVSWNSEKEKNLEIDMGEAIKSVIKTTLKKLNTQKKLEMSFIPLYERFAEEK